MKTYALVFVLMLPACGGSSSTSTTPVSGEGGSDKPAASASAGAENAPPPEAKEKLEFPTACAKVDDKADKKDDLCSVPASFTKHLCSAPNASSLALAMYSKGMPWARAYVARDTEAWDPSGSGVGSAQTKLLRDEEVLVLAFHPPANTGGMQVSGATGTYDVLRWDGVCASLNADELRKWMPPEPGYASIPWKKLDDGMQQKLLADGRIALKEGEMKKACKGLSRGQTNPACDKAQKSLSKAVVGYVRNGGDIPTPTVP